MRVWHFFRRPLAEIKGLRALPHGEIAQRLVPNTVNQSAELDLQHRTRECLGAIVFSMVPRQFGGLLQR
jgi:hypothetical protein